LDELLTGSFAIVCPTLADDTSLLSCAEQPGVVERPNCTAYCRQVVLAFVVVFLSVAVGLFQPTKACFSHSSSGSDFLELFELPTNEVEVPEETRIISRVRLF